MICPRCLGYGRLVSVLNAHERTNNNLGKKELIEVDLLHEVEVDLSKTQVIYLIFDVDKKIKNCCQYLVTVVEMTIVSQNVVHV